MTVPLGGNAVNLAALAVPIMPETSHLGEQMQRVGEQMHRDLMSGFGRASGGGSNAENVGNTLGAQIMSGFQKKIASADFGFFSTALDKMNERVDERLANVLQAKLPAAMQDYRRAIDEVGQAEDRHTLATQRLTDAKNAQGVPFTVMTGLMRDEKNAHDDLVAAQGKAVDKQEELTTKTNEFQAASARVISTGGVMGGLVGGALVLGFNALTGAIESVIELGEHIFEAAIEGAKEFADKLVEVGEDYATLKVQITEFSGASGDALTEMNEHTAQIFSQLDVAGKNLGQTYAQLHSMLDIEPGPELDNLARKVTDLQGRFANLRAADLGAIFREFKVPAGEFNSALDTMVDNASHAGEGLGDLASTMQGKVGVTLAQANLSLGNAADFLGELHKAGIPATDVVTGLGTAMSKLTKSGMDFPDAMREVVKELLNSTQAQQDSISATLFSGRRWTEVVPALEALNTALNANEDAHNGAAGAAQNMITETELLDNKIEAFKHQIEAMVAPWGEKFLEGVEGALNRVKIWFDQNHTVVTNKIKEWGDKFIDMLPKIRQWAQIILELMGPTIEALVAGFEPLMMILTEAGAGVLALGGHFKDAMELLKAPAAVMDGTKGLKTNLDNLSQSLNKIDLSPDKLKEWKSSLDDTVDSTNNWFTSQSNVNGALNDYSNTPVGPGDSVVPGGGLGNSGGTPTLPAPGGVTPLPPGGTPGVHTAGYNTTSGGGGVQQVVYQAMLNAGFGPDQWGALSNIVQNESGWDPTVSNGGGHGAPSNTSAFGLGQFLGHMNDEYGAMGAYSGDPAMEAAAMMEYIKNRYGSPAAAWEHWQANHSYAEGGSVQNTGSLLGAGLFSGLLNGLGMVTGGKGGIDDVLIRATAGEMVMNKGASEKFGPLLELLNAKGFQGGGKVGGDDSSGVMQVIWDDTETGAKIGEASGYGWVGPGTNQPQYYGNDWAGHTGHVHTSFSRNPYTGEPYTQVRAGSDIRQGQPGFPDWVYQLGQEFGLQPSTYAGHQEWDGVNHGIDWWPMGKANMQGAGYTHQDHAMLTNFAEAVGSLGAGGSPGSPGSGSSYGGGGGGAFAASPAGYGTTRGGGSGLPNPFAGGGPDGSYNPTTGLQGLPGQYGGLGAYGGETYDQQIEHQNAITNAKHDVDVLERERDRLRDEQLPKIQKQLDDEQAKLPIMQDQDKITNLTNEIRDKKEQLDDLNNRQIPQANSRVDEAQHRSDEAELKSPSGMKSGAQSPEFTESQQLGRGLLSGIAQELGFPDIFGKPPWEFGSVKMLMKGLGIGLDWLEGPLGMKLASKLPGNQGDSQFPVNPAQDPSPFGPDRGALPGPDDGSGDSGVNVHLPVSIPHTGQPPQQSGNAPRSDRETNMNPSWRSPNGKVMPADYHHHEGDIHLHGVENSQIVSAAKNFQHSWDRNQHHVNSPGTFHV